MKSQHFLDILHNFTDLLMQEIVASVRQ